MPSRKIEPELERLKALRAAGPVASTISALRAALADRSNVLVAKAAQLAGEMECRQLVPDLVRAFERLFQNPVKTDPQCWGKNALAKALKDLDYQESVLFLRGMRHTQMEPGWGGPTDTAVTLRGTCALALVQCRDLPRQTIVRMLLDVLTDASAPVRMDAIRALEQMDGEAVILLLRLKAKVGDADTAVTGQAFESLLSLEASRSVEFVADFLRHPEDAVREEAALALGVSRLEQAVQVLIQSWNETGHGEALLRAISSSRTEPAIQFLLQLVARGREADAVAAVGALALHAASEDICAQTSAAVQTRTESAIQAAFRSRFRR